MRLPYFAHAAVAALSCAAAAQAQNYPAKPIRVLVPFAAGSATDTVGRSYTAKFSELLGQSGVVDNRPGANGMIGAEAVAKAAPDGYTILCGTNSTNAALKSLYKKLPYDQDKDFSPIAFLGSVPLIVAVNNNLPVKNLRDLMAMAKNKPGEVLYASASTSQRVSTEMFANMAGIKLTMVPYKSSPQAISELIAGQVMMFTADLAVTMPQVKAGKIRGLAVTSIKRTALIDLPTVAEAGGLKGYELIAWFAAYAPRGTPQPVIERLNAAFNTAANSKDVKDRLIAFGVETSAHTPAQLAERTRVETVKWAKAIKDAGIQPE
jgi:tripartite-type tricarboxylate transporter receptor subunit TctC